MFYEQDFPTLPKVAFVPLSDQWKPRFLAIDQGPKVASMTMPCKPAGPTLPSPTLHLRGGGGSTRDRHYSPDQSSQDPRFRRDSGRRDHYDNFQGHRFLPEQGYQSGPRDYGTNQGQRQDPGSRVPGFPGRYGQDYYDNPSHGREYHDDARGRRWSPERNMRYGPPRYTSTNNSNRFSPRRDSHPVDDRLPVMRDYQQRDYTNYHGSNEPRRVPYTQSDRSRSPRYNRDGGKPSAKSVAKPQQLKKGYKKWTRGDNPRRDERFDRGVFFPVHDGAFVQGNPALSHLKEEIPTLESWIRGHNLRRDKRFDRGVYHPVFDRVFIEGNPQLSHLKEETLQHPNLKASLPTVAKIKKEAPQHPNSKQCLPTAAPLAAKHTDKIFYCPYPGCPEGFVVAATLVKHLAECPLRETGVMPSHSAVENDSKVLDEAPAAVRVKLEALVE